MPCSWCTIYISQNAEVAPCRIRYNEEYLEQQVFFHPFPEALAERAGE